jgi:hypothetical protein
LRRLLMFDMMLHTIDSFGWRNEIIGDFSHIAPTLDLKPS